MAPEKILVKNMETKKVSLHKKELRRRILTQRNGLLTEDNTPTSEKLFLDQCIRSYLCMHEMKHPCMHYLCYVNYKSEVDTTGFISYLLEKGKHVYVPKVLDSQHMDFFEIQSHSKLSVGYQNIPEPAGDMERKLQLEKDKQYCMILPGAVFDKKGNRIGYGKGYYDTYLADCISQNISMEKVAICYDFQVTEPFETEPFDVRMDMIYTEKGNIL